MIRKSKETDIMFRLYYMMSHKGDEVFVKLIRTPKIGKNIKWGLIGDPKHYTFSELSKKIFEKPLKKGVPLKFNIINEETGLKAGIGIDVSYEWPKEPCERPENSLDISEQIKEIN